MRVIFAGTPDFACPTLKVLLDIADVTLVLTQPDRPAGRGRQLQASPVKQLAMAHGRPVWQPKTLRDPEVQAQLLAMPCDLMVVVAYGLLIPKPLLDWPTHGCLNVHASLLPRWRGAAPIQHALLQGDAQTGVSLMRLDEGMDTGPVYCTASMPIDADATSGSLMTALADLGAQTLRQFWPTLGQVPARMQPKLGVTHAGKLTKAQAKIDWHQPAEVLERAIRAYQPWPVSHCLVEGVQVRIWQARVAAYEGDAPVGSVIDLQDGVWVACGSGALVIEAWQWPGKTMHRWGGGHPWRIGQALK